MNTNPLPDLSTWHEVPDDADVPEKQPVVFVRPDGEWGVIRGGSIPLIPSDRIAGSRYFTADPIPAPRPAPPTKPGTVLAEVFDGRDTCAAMLFFSGEWYGVDQDGEYRFWKSDDLVSWTVADVTPRKADPLDESDHRDRVDYAGDILRWFPNGKWEWPELYPEATEGRATLADCASWTTLRFADEADQS